MGSSFNDLGLVTELCDACKRAGWSKPTEIQEKSIPLALQGKDVVGLAKTGSGKTGAYVLPMIQCLLAKPQRLFAVVLVPTRELAFQIKEHILAIGTGLGVKVAAVTGGMDMKAEQVKLNERPHIVVGTPGRILDHLKRTKSFNLSRLKYLVFDEADKMLGVDLEHHMNDILRVLPTERRTMLFSATMNKSAQHLERACLSSPAIVTVDEPHKTVDTLKQSWHLVPFQHRIGHLAWFLNSMKADKDKSKTFIVFCNSTKFVLIVHLTLKMIGFETVPLYGKMEQNKRMGALNKFKRKERNILVATNVASRGLDIPGVDFVINFDLPVTTKEYVHRVGRTARAGRSGQSITFASQANYIEFLELEDKLGFKMESYPFDMEEISILLPVVEATERDARNELEKMRGELSGVPEKKKKRSRESDSHSFRLKKKKKS